MLLPRFSFERPDSLAEALGLLGRPEGGAQILAGGTDLLVNMKKGTAAPSLLVSLDGLGSLDEVSTRGGRLALGATAVATRIAAHAGVRRRFTALAEGAGNLGPPLIRCRATVGGSLITARPAADLLPPLLALEARVSLTGPGGDRELPVDEFFLGPGQTRRRPGEILIGVRALSPPAGSGSAYMKLGIRQICEISIVNAAAALTLSPDGRRVSRARLALGAVAPTPIRCPVAESALEGRVAGPRALARAAREAALEARPISDHRGSSDYRTLMAEVLVRRALENALERAREAAS
jgi:carbon-monoxide dehydrogenase medium subunit